MEVEVLLFVPNILSFMIFCWSSFFVFCKLCIVEPTREDVKLRKISRFAILLGTVYAVCVNSLVVDIELRMFAKHGVIFWCVEWVAYFLMKQLFIAEWILEIKCSNFRFEYLPWFYVLFCVTFLLNKVFELVVTIEHEKPLPKRGSVKYTQCLYRLCQI